MAEKARDHVLALLAKEWELSGPPGILDLSEIVAALPLAPSEALAAVKDACRYWPEAGEAEAVGDLPGDENDLLLFAALES